ncbi:MAG: uncharacterized protein QOF76_376 [Solirubrobacteraceae bacterium]|jgi:hypothetical protein|nr:uncharacterized protein [Solirubrobacteraceae bacterium]
MMRRVLAVLGVIAATAAAPAVAQSPGLHLDATAKPRGHIALTVSGGPPGASVALTDTTDDPVDLGTVDLDATGTGTLKDAATWTCTTRRTFNAATEAGGVPLSADDAVRTPSCADRYTLEFAKGKHRAGRPLRVRVTDTFGLDDQAVKVCLTGPAKQCAPVKRDRATLTPPRPGRYTITARAPGAGAPATKINVKRKPGPVQLLATGDSMIQILDDFLADRLAPRHVITHKDAHISTGLTKPFLLDWPQHARELVAKLHPDVTVMFLGANDGYGFGNIACCGKRWVKLYAKRVDGMIKTYAQDGRASVYWCLLPAPRAANFRRVFIGVNKAIHRAVRQNPKTAHLVDLPKTFTPGYRFQQDLGGKSVRQDDGVHLNVAGASIAANIIRRQLRRDGAV